MNKKFKNICTFTFANGSKIRAAVETFDDKGEPIPFIKIFQAAMCECWQGNEIGRGELVSFKIGGQIISQG